MNAKALTIMAGKPVTGEMCKALRKSMDRNQTAFWTPLGVTQSASSRYETGRSIPKPLQTLIVVAYGSEAQSAKAVADIRKTVSEGSAE